MSGPVPSPSIKGMIGSSGIASPPFVRVMAVPVVGAFVVVKVGIRSRPRLDVSGCSQKLWKSLWKSSARLAVAPHHCEHFSGLHHHGATALVATNATL